MTTFLTVALYVLCASDQVGLEDETVHVADALLLQYFTAGMGHPGTCGPVSAEAAPTPDPDDEADGEDPLLCRHRLRTLACSAQAQNVISNHTAH